ncbi:unnamed protein product [Rotaria sp. Silwood2]|nr:unnamed protein product [Rotaria sp. Silwood2]
MSSYSSIRSLANCLNKLLSEKCVTSDITTKNVLCVLQKYIESLDEHWSHEKQQSHWDKCINEMKDIINTNVLMMDVETYSNINNTFNTLESTITTAMENKHVEPEGYQMISSALSELRQTIIKLFSQLINANKSIEKEFHETKIALKNVEARLANMEADSLAIKKSNFIADLMQPLLNKIMDEMETNSIDQHLYSPRELSRLKVLINRKENWLVLHPLGRIIDNIASTYGLTPSVLIDYLRIKQDRNSLARYTQKIRTYALQSKEAKLSDFIMKYTELQSISELEMTVLEPVFLNICKQIVATPEITEE